MRLKGQALIVLTAIMVMIVLYATDQVAPAGSAREAQLRIWLAARATGLTALLLLTCQVVLGLILSHPTNQSTWKLSKRLFPWHENLFVFIVSFLAVHIVFLVLDPTPGSASAVLWSRASRAIGACRSPSASWRCMPWS